MGVNTGSPLCGRGTKGNARAKWAALHVKLTGRTHRAGKVPLEGLGTGAGVQGAPRDTHSPHRLHRSRSLDCSAGDPSPGFFSLPSDLTAALPGTVQCLVWSLSEKSILQEKRVLSLPSLLISFLDSLLFGSDYICHPQSFSLSSPALCRAPKSATAGRNSRDSEARTPFPS